MAAMDWLKILTACGVRSDRAASWAPVFDAEIKPGTFSAGGSELDDFLGQVLHESNMLSRLEENLNYTSAARIAAVWPTRFKDASDAEAFVRNPRGLANKVYGGRMGNHGPNDGWKYRGRGLIQVTGWLNYESVGKRLGLDLIADPDLLASPAIALRASIAWWEGNIPDHVMGNIRKVTQRVNGGTVGLEHREQLTQAADRADGRADGAVG